VDQKPSVEHFYKQPDETFFVAANYVDVLSTGETIVVGNSEVSAVDEDDNDATGDILEVASLVVQDTTKLAVRVKAGVETGSPYKITINGVTSLSNNFEVDIEMRIEDL